MKIKPSYKLTAQNCRAFETLSLTAVYLAVALEASNTLFKLPDDRPPMRIHCPIGGKDVMVPVTEYLDCFLHGAPFPPELELIFIDALGPPVKPITAEGSGNVGSLVTAAFFALFVEQANDYVRLSKGSDYANWPPVSNFARVIRNAIVHGQRVNMANQRAVSATWRGRTISPADNGRKIINTGEYSFGDLILLMLDLDQELSGLGAPIPLG